MFWPVASFPLALLLRAGVERGSPRWHSLSCCSLVDLFRLVYLYDVNRLCVDFDFFLFLVVVLGRNLRCFSCLLLLVCMLLCVLQVPGHWLFGSHDLRTAAFG